MRVLLDTHVCLWAFDEVEHLADSAASVLEDPNTEPLLSAVSSWEAAIKYQLGRVTLPSHPRDCFPTWMREAGVAALPIEHAHTFEVATLERHHADPFDRLLIAQAKVERLPIMTADSVFERYDVEVIRAA